MWFVPDMPLWGPQRLHCECSSEICSQIRPLTESVHLLAAGQEVHRDQQGLRTAGPSCRHQSPVASCVCRDWCRPNSDYGLRRAHAYGVILCEGAF